MKNSPISGPRLVPLIVADVFELAGAFRRQGEHLARTVGQSQARWQVLSAASAEPKTVPQIARRLGVTRQAVQRLANMLVHEGLAELRANPDHQGSPHLVLTDRGSAALARLAEEADRYHRAITGRLDAGELGAVHAGLRRLLAALADAGPDEERRPVRTHEAEPR
jgi:DNA-binding MarR family transcriptional regulator